MVCSYNGILFSHIKKWNIDTCYTTEESQKHFAMWKKSDTKAHIIIQFHLYEIPKTGKSTKTESRLVVARG